MIEEQEQKRFEDNLFIDEQLQRHTKLTPPDAQVFNVLLQLGKRIDWHRQTFFNVNKKEECTVTSLANIGLRLRVSIDGWRSKQVVEIQQNKTSNQIESSQGGFGKRVIEFLGGKK